MRIADSDCTIASSRRRRSSAMRPSASSRRARALRSASSSRRSYTIAPPVGGGLAIVLAGAQARLERRERHLHQRVAERQRLGVRGDRDVVRRRLDPRPRAGACRRAALRRAHRTRSCRRPGTASARTSARARSAATARRSAGSSRRRRPRPRHRPRPVRSALPTATTSRPPSASTRFQAAITSARSSSASAAATITTSNDSPSFVRSARCATARYSRFGPPVARARPLDQRLVAVQRHHPRRAVGDQVLGARARPAAELEHLSAGPQGLEVRVER